MNDFLIPYFARVTDYSGLWCIEPRAAEGLLAMARSIDLAAHVRANLLNPPKVQSPLSLIPTGKGKNSLGVVSILGTMMKGQSSMGGTSTIAARRAIRQAADDPNISSIILALDSPGGTVAGTQDLAADVVAARRKKAVIAHIDDMAASAAYWVASQASAVYANAATALIGNVGTYLIMEDSSGAAEKAGVKEVAFTSGPLKVFGGNLGINAEQSAHMQGIVDSLQEQFMGAVRRSRGLSDSRVKEVSSGAIYTAERALSLGLIDGIRSLGKTIAEFS